MLLFSIFSAIWVFVAFYAVLSQIRFVVIYGLFQVNYFGSNLVCVKNLSFCISGRPLLVCEGGGLYMEVVTCTWRRWPVLAHRSFYVEAWPVHEGGGLHVKVGSCIWRRLPVLAHRGFYVEHGPYMKAVACM